MRLKHIVSAAFSFVIFASASAALAAPPCAGCQAGDQCTINGKTHTCGFSGGTRCVLVGDLTAADANKACDCLHDRTVDCNPASAVKSKVKAAKAKAIAPAKRALKRTGR